MKSIKNLVVLSLFLLSGLAHAHVHLKNSAPENGAMLNNTPKHIMIEFSGKVRLVKLQLTKGSDKPIKLIKSPTPNFQYKHQIKLPQLSQGEYKVSWIAMGQDAHKMKNHVIFTVNSNK